MGEVKNVIYETIRPLVLASGSPRRRELLSVLGPDLIVRPARVKEPDPESGESPKAYALRTAELKAGAVFRKSMRSREFQAGSPIAILAADTVVCLQTGILGKPKNRPEAVEMLSMLSGKTHTVVTGCSLIFINGPEEDQIEMESFAVSTAVTMCRMSPKEAQAYAAAGEPMDKAGAYAVQGMGGAFVKEIQGSHSNVVGLPLAEVLEVLMKRRVVRPVCQG